MNYLGVLLKCRFCHWSGMEPKMLHFSPVSRRCGCCWPQGPHLELQGCLCYIPTLERCSSPWAPLPARSAMHTPLLPSHQIWGSFKDILLLQRRLRTAFEEMWFQLRPLSFQSDRIEVTGFKIKEGPCRPARWVIEVHTQMIPSLPISIVNRGCHFFHKLCEQPPQKVCVYRDHSSVSD